MWQKFKAILTDAIADDTLYFSLLLVAVAVASFGLGRMTNSGAVPAQTPVVPALLPVHESEPLDMPSSEAPPEIMASEGVVASKSGTKYHFPWCPGAKQMKEENKIYFASSAEAEAAGYTKASNCKGL